MSWNRVAALRLALAFASKRIKVLPFLAQAFVKTGTAFAADWIPDSSTRALVNSVLVSKCIKLGVRRNTIAVTSASLMVPHVVWRASLPVASTFALLGVPVVRVIKAGLRSAFVVAGIQVKGVQIAVLDKWSSECAAPLS